MEGAGRALAGPGARAPADRRTDGDSPRSGCGAGLRPDQTLSAWPGWSWAALVQVGVVVQGQIIGPVQAVESLVNRVDKGEGANRG